jgi:glucose-6-phosphate dehydrogenase assembly protein OpcA
MIGAFTAIDLLNFAVGAVTVVLGLMGWLAPRWTMQFLDMQAGPTKMAYTEVSAVSGCLFVGMGLGAIILNEPLAWVVLGLAYGGAALGRVTSILRDNAGSRQSWTFFGTEAALAAWLIIANM